MVRYEYLDHTISEKKIHPDDIFENEKSLAKQFVTKEFKSNGVEPCPFCGSQRSDILFEKWGIKYALCLKDWSLSIATPPSELCINNYFFKSELSKFRAYKDYQDTISKERHYIWENLINWIEGRISRYLGNDKYSTMAWGPKYVGWIERLSRATFVGELNIKCPIPPIKSAENKIKDLDIVCLIDVLQRQPDPLSFMKNVYDSLAENGVVVITCRSGSGFDILTLKENSISIFPLDHICLPSPHGLKKLLETAGFEILEMTTPGMLDVQYVKNHTYNIPDDQLFQRYFFTFAETPELERFQGFLQQNNLSSHIRCIAKKH